MSPYVGRLTNKHITTTCPQWHFSFDEKIRFWLFEILDARVKTPFVWWRHRPTVKSVRFLPLMLPQSVHLCCRKVREHGKWFYLKPDLSNRTVRQSNPIEHQSSDCRTQSNIIEFTIKFCQSNTIERSITERLVIEPNRTFDYRTIGIIERSINGRRIAW